MGQRYDTSVPETLSLEDRSCILAENDIPSKAFHKTYTEKPFLTRNKKAEIALS